MSIHWHWPQVILVILLVGPTLTDLIFGKRTATYALLAIAYEAFLMWLLYSGGFFSQV